MSVVRTRVILPSVIEARDFGVTGNAADDQTAALQAAIDFCQLKAVPGQGNAPTLRLPPGQIMVSSTIIWKSCGISGAWPTNGTSIVWNGALNGTVLQKWATSHPGNMSYCLLENIKFVSGTSEPATFIDLTANTEVVDWGFRLRELHFVGCRGDAIKMGPWINCHWEHLRFDWIGGYAIRMTPGSSQFLSSFVLDGFTYDHHRDSNPGGGVIMIDNTAGATNMGCVEIANGRIEINAAWAAAGAPGTGAASSRAIVCLRSAGGGGARVAGLSLRNVTYQDASGMADDSLLFYDSVGSTGNPTLFWSNVRANSLSAVLGGNWYAGIVSPATSDLASIGALEPHVSGANLVFGVGARIYNRTGSPESVVTAPVGSLFLRSDGGAGTTLYVKESGAAATGWVAK